MCPTIARSRAISVFRGLGGGQLRDLDFKDAAHAVQIVEGYAVGPGRIQLSGSTSASRVTWPTVVPLPCLLSSKPFATS